jgi:hypothetical protein
MNERFMHLTVFPMSLDRRLLEPNSCPVTGCVHAFFRGGAAARGVEVLASPISSCRVGGVGGCEGVGDSARGEERGRGGWKGIKRGEAYLARRLSRAYVKYLIGVWLQQP